MYARNIFLNRDEAQIVYDITDTVYPASTSPPTSNAGTIGGIIGDQRSRSYTHSGLSLEQRARSGSNESRMRSLSLIDSIHPRHAPPGPPPPLLDDRSRSHSQGSETSNLIPTEHRETSPRAGAEQQKVPQHMTSFEESYYPSELGSTNGHFPPGAQQQLPQQHPAQQHPAQQHPAQQHPTQQHPAQQPEFPKNYPTEAASEFLMLNGLPSLHSTNLSPPDEPRSKEPPQQHSVMDTWCREQLNKGLGGLDARYIQQQKQQQEQRRSVESQLMNLSLGNMQQVPLNLLGKVQLILKQRLDEVNKTIAVREQMACVICHERVRSVFIHPCSHFVACQECLTVRNVCPVCSCEIHKYYPVLL